MLRHRVTREANLALVGSIFAALGAGVFALLLLSAVLTGNGTAFGLAALGLFILLPWPVRGLRAGFGGWAAALRGLAAVALLLATGYAMLAQRPPSIYKSEAVRSQFLGMHDEKMSGWPRPFEDRFVETGYGQVHVIVSGLAEGPPMLLLHASGVSSWSWRANAAALGAAHRLYAIDTIGDAGKSAYADLDHVLSSRADQAALYDEIMSGLGIP